MCILKCIARILVLIGALNWGAIGVFNYNFVAAILGTGAMTNVMGAERVIYILVGIAALICVICMVLCRLGHGCCCKLCKSKHCPCCTDKSKCCCSKEHMKDKERKDRRE